jgi:hypothetical protein
MLDRFVCRALVVAGLALSLAGCGNNAGLDSVSVSPSSQSLSVGQSLQFTATGTYGNANHSSTQNITSTVTWTSSIPSVATVSSAGVATALSPGTTSITASATAYNGPVSSSAVLTVPGTPAGGTSGSSGGGILSLTIIPSGIDFGSLGASGQFLAIGTFSTAPTVRDLTNSVTWLTSAPNVFPITSNSGAGAGTAPGTGTQNGGVVSAYGASTGNVGATITAEAMDSNGSIATATATVGCPYVAATAGTPATGTTPAVPATPGSCNNNVAPLLSTLTFYNEGLNPGTAAQGGNWLVTAPSATGTPAVLHCGPGWTGSGGSVCTATYPLGATVTLTAPAQTGVKFGGWSSNCTNTGVITQTGPNTCTINMGSTVDATVAAIFN